MGKILIIGAGGVARVTAHKCAEDKKTFSQIFLASRTLAKCETIAAECEKKYDRKITCYELDADDIDASTALIKKTSANLVLNLALPYQDLNIMRACLQAGANYLDTANYEAPELAHFEYKEQWALDNDFKKAGLTALLGSGFDPGMTNVYCAHAQKHIFKKIEYIDILDCNDGDHGKAFATNFNPEINIREVTAAGRYFEDGEWHKTQPLAVATEFDFPQVGKRKIYLLYHEEMESLARNIEGIRRMRFWMTFSDKYLKHLEVLQNVGMTSIEPIVYQGKKIVPLQFLKAVLPEPAELGKDTKGKTCIGCLISGRKYDDKTATAFVFNICEHEKCFAETNSQAVSYTTGVPATSGAAMMLKGLWRKKGVWNMEQFDPEPFLEDVSRRGLPYRVIYLEKNPLL